MYTFSDIGFSISSHPAKSAELLPVLEEMLASGCNTIELAPIYETSEHYQPYSDGFLNLVRKFRHRSVHLPAKGVAHDNLASARYFDDLIDAAQIQLLTFHPTQLEIYSWLDENFGDMLSAENMDYKKDFGQTPQDMMEVFAALPSAQWTFDVNHVLTNDSSLELGRQLMNTLGERLARYHLSGWGGSNLDHTLLSETKQNQLISLMTRPAPIIIESFGEADIKNFAGELAYIKALLQK